MIRLFYVLYQIPVNGFFRPVYRKGAHSIIPIRHLAVCQCGLCHFRIAPRIHGNSFRRRNAV